jgi:hypothetical protein
MNKASLAAFGAVALLVAGIGVGWLAAIRLEVLPPRYPAIQQDISERVDLGFLSQGIVRETGAYRTSDEPVTVAGWYRSRYQAQPSQSKGQSDACLQLVRENSWRLARLTVVISLCPSGQGTEISYSRQLTWGQ